MPETKPSLASVLAKEFRGNTDIKSFLVEKNALTDEDRAWFAERFRIERGITVTV